MSKLFSIKPDFQKNSNLNQILTLESDSQGEIKNGKIPMPNKSIELSAFAVNLIVETRHKR